MAEGILPTCKPCKKCGESNRYPSGKCKPCGDSGSKKYAAENPEKRKATRSNWYEKNKEAAIASRIAYRKANLEKERAYSVAYIEKNKVSISIKSAAYREKNKARFKARDAEKYRAQTEKCKAYNKHWYANNPDAVSVKNQNRRARVKSVGGKLSKGLPQQLFALQRGKCACCGQPLGENYHLDHIMPLALGGSNTDDNIQLLRSVCNNQKHAQHPVDFMQDRGFLL